jgi:hypothetical protein
LEYPQPTEKELKIRRFKSLRPRDGSFSIFFRRGGRITFLRAKPACRQTRRRGAKGDSLRLGAFARVISFFLPLDCLGQDEKRKEERLI